MNTTGLICILLAQLLTGGGVVRLFKLQLPVVQYLCLSMITGVILISFVPCLMQLFHVPISYENTRIALGIFTAVCSVPLIVLYKKPVIGRIYVPQLYELPFLIVILFFVTTSLFRCFYYPPTPRDILAGSEMIAEFTVREKTMVNSVYSIDLHTTNNQFKSPILTSMQIIYKLYVCPFGQVWLSSIFIPLLVLIYSLLRQRIHALLACLLLMLFMAIPDVFAYSYIILYDYTNMVLFFFGFYFMMQYLQEKRSNDFAFSVFLFGLATYVRVETLFLVGMVSLMPAWYQFKEKVKPATIVLRAGILIGVSAVFYFICMNIFVKNFVPMTYDTAGQINKNLSDVSAFFDRATVMSSELIFAHKGVLVYGYFMYFFLTVLIADLLFTRKVNKEGRMILYGISVVYFGLALLGYILPLFDLLNTTKRGLFKIIPLMLFYMANSSILQKVSDYLIRKETGIRKEPTPTPIPVAAKPQPKVMKGKK